MLLTCCSGHWGATSGDLAKFGLRCPEIVEVVDELTAVGMLDCLQLLHFHVGSQVNASLACFCQAPCQLPDKLRQTAAVWMVVVAEVFAVTKVCAAYAWNLCKHKVALPTCSKVLSRASCSA